MLLFLYLAILVILSATFASTVWGGTVKMQNVANEHRLYYLIKELLNA